MKKYIKLINLLIFIFFVSHIVIAWNAPSQYSIMENRENYSIDVIVQSINAVKLSYILMVSIGLLAFIRIILTAYTKKIDIFGIVIVVVTLFLVVKTPITIFNLSEINITTYNRFWFDYYNPGEKGFIITHQSIVLITLAINGFAGWLKSISEKLIESGEENQEKHNI